MHLLIFGHPFSELVALILLPGLAFYFLNKKKARVPGNAEDADTGASGPSVASKESNSGGSSAYHTETNDGGSSSMTALTENCYEVFLSFRGPDTRYGFTDHLYNGLLGAGINVFRDNDELCQGENIRPELLAAITKSKILIPILSESYGTSGWCLDELVQIMECKKNTGQIVLPVFYKVKPAEVRHQIGSFGDAFRERERRSRVRSSFDPAMSEKWKKALDEVSTLKGYEADGYEGELVKSIVQKVLSELRKEFELVIPENLVGIDAHVEKVMKLVNNNSSATLFVGICGMGGIGKTTLAKTIYNKLSNQFKNRSFIADIKESCRHSGLDYLQNQLIFDVLKHKIEVSNKDDGIKFISSKFKDKKVLILVDDVDDDDQLRALVGNHNWFSSGSRILITTRNSSILDNARVDHKYEHEEMDENQSMILFSRHAFRRSSPPSKFEDLARDVIITTGGLPLSLEVLGSFLCGKEPTFWRSTIDKLGKVPHKKVREKLRISYEELDDGQKQIFLDIACFFVGTDRRIASYMWDASGFFPGEGVEVLRFMSLIKIGDDHILQMHDQLRDLGREIVREENQQEPQYRSRLWDSKEVRKVLKENKGTDKIEAINLSEHSWGGFGKSTDIYTEKQFKNLTSLRFLQLKGPCLRGDFEDSMEELKWLRWQNCPMNFEVKNCHVKELVVLEILGSAINGEWKGWSSFMMVEKLKFLNLSYSRFLENTDFLSSFKNLEVLILNGCESLQRIDSSIEDMKGLRRLELCRCGRLRKLPEEIGKLKALEQLLLQETDALSALPDSIGSLENLEILHISYSGIEELPNSIGRLRKLRELVANGCIKLRGEMPESMSNLSSLRRLNFLGHHELQLLWGLPSNLTDLRVTCQSHELPSLSHLTHLKVLWVWNCRFLKCIQAVPSELPESLYTTFQLETLVVSGCDSIETLDVSQFMNLRELSILARPSKLEARYKKKTLLEVQGVDKLIYLEELTVQSCGFKRLDLQKSKCLKILDVCDCDDLVEIQGLDRLEFLESLDISSCTSIERLLLPKSRSMKKLFAEGCENLAKIEGLDTLELHIEGCTSMERLDLSKSGRLKNLIAADCKNLAKIQDLDRLEFLESLIISGCTSIERLLLPKSRSMKELHASSCKNLAEIQDIDRLEFLEVLCIEGCTSIQRLDLPKSGSMKKLDAGGCENLAKIEGLDTLELTINECTSIERLDLSKSWRLKKLKARGCKNLVEIQDLDRLEFLESLIISGCALIERLLLPKSRSMNELHARGCENLAKIEGLDTLELDINGCTSIDRLNLSKSRRLKKLTATGCKNLTKIEGLDTLELYINGCPSIERLELSKSRRLKKLQAEGCNNLAEIQDLDRLEFLENLIIFGCTSIERLLLPKSRSMELVYVEGCENLAKIEGLDTLKLHIKQCSSIERIELSKSGRLKKLKVEGCKILAEIQDLDRLELLESLIIYGCTSIERLLLPKSRSMKKLYVGGCENLAKIEGLDTLELHIEQCTSIERLDLSKSGRLKKLKAEGCKNLAEIQDLDRLEFLESLIISGCTSIERLLLPKSRSMKELNASFCKNLTIIQDMDKLEFLEVLHIEGCTSIERLDLPKSGSMEELYVGGCENLAKIEGLNILKLHVEKCTSIERLDLSKSGRLKKLKAEGCKNLAEIQDLDRLEFLKSLHISGCTSIERLDLSKFGRLKILTVEGCKNLTKIQDLDRLEFLESLHISGCTSIERLDLPKTRTLKTLYAKSCKKLAEIQGLDRSEFLEELNIEGCTSIKRLDLPKSGRLEALDAGDCENLVEIQGLDRLELLEKMRIIGCKSLKTDLELYRSCIYEEKLFETVESESDYSY